MEAAAPPPTGNHPFPLGAVVAAASCHPGGPAWIACKDQLHQLPIGLSDLKNPLFSHPRHPLLSKTKFLLSSAKCSCLQQPLNSPKPSPPGLLKPTSQLPLFFKTLIYCLRPRTSNQSRCESYGRSMKAVFFLQESRLAKSGAGRRKISRLLTTTNLIEYEYNFLSERFMIQCMPTPTHDSLQNFFNRRVSVSLAAKVGIQQADALVEVGSGTSKLWNKSCV